MKQGFDLTGAMIDATIFFNSGGADIYRPEYHNGQTHFEMEDLPTAWGGYDKMPPRASVMSRYKKEYLGMTGKFHTEWGEFGGYKNPEALKYEALLMAMYGAKFIRKRPSEIRRAVSAMLSGN